jgi:hypothetical protein
MLEKAGWKRAWMLATGGIFLWMILRALKHPNVLDVSGSSADCVPGTYVESFGGTTFSCTSYLGLIFALIAAALISVGIAAVFRLFRWTAGRLREK